MASNYATLNPKRNIGPHDLMAKYPLPSHNAPMIQIVVVGQTRGNHQPPANKKTMKVALNIHHINTNVIDVYTT